MEGHFFLLEDGKAVKAITISEVGGIARTVNADRVAAQEEVVEACRMLLGMCLFEAQPGAWDNGIAAQGVNQGEDAARKIMDRAEKALAEVGIRFSLPPSEDEDEAPFEGLFDIGRAG